MSNSVDCCPYSHRVSPLHDRKNPPQSQRLDCFALWGGATDRAAEQRDSQEAGAGALSLDEERLGLLGLDERRKHPLFVFERLVAIGFARATPFRPFEFELLKPPAESPGPRDHPTSAHEK